MRIPPLSLSLLALLRLVKVSPRRSCFFATKSLRLITSASFDAKDHCCGQRRLPRARCLQYLFVFGKREDGWKRDTRVSGLYKYFITWYFPLWKVATMEGTSSTLRRSGHWRGDIVAVLESSGSREPLATFSSAELRHRYASRHVGFRAFFPGAATSANMHLLIYSLWMPIMVRWPSGLRRQTKDQSVRHSYVSGPKGRGFESHSHHTFWKHSQ